jgi:hypothetical protein
MSSASRLRKRYGDDYSEEELQVIKATQLFEVWQTRKSLGSTLKNQPIFESKVETYNRTVDALNKLVDSRRVDPLLKLPQELCHQILSDAASEALELHLIETLITWTLVSRRWMNFILHNPLYWTNVCLDTKLRDWFPVALLCLRLSGNLPITMHMISSFKDWDVIQPMLLEHRSRIKRIVIKTRSPGGLLWTDRHIFLKINSLLPLPRLVDFHTPPWSGIELPIVELNPALKSQQWKRVVFSCSLLSVLPKLEAIPSLETVEGSFQRWHYSPYQQIYLESDGYRTLGWKKLIYSGPRFPLQIIWRLTKLTSLTLVTSISDIVPFLNQIHSLLNLSELDWKIGYFSSADYFQDGKLTTSPPSVYPNKAVKSLTLKIPSPSPTIGLNELIVEAFPCVSSLLLTPGTLSNLQVLLGVEGFKDAQNVQIFSVPRYSLVHIGELLPCETMSIASIDNLSEHLSGRTIKSLFVDHTKNQAQFVVFHPNLWPSIESLRIPVASILGSDMNFSYLRELTLITIPSSIDLNMTRFCSILALDPSKCPALENLTLRQCPEWDIYFIMLENRNLRGSHGAKSFKMLGLPACSPPHLHRHLCDIIKGKVPRRPSNFELSFLGSMEMVLDPTM